MLITRLIGAKSLRNALLVVRILFMELKTIVKLDLWFWDNKNFIFDSLVNHAILYGCTVWGCDISTELWRRIEEI